jgi:23S rRNA (guanosine2251-2'-O)-methyltransferase
MKDFSKKKTNIDLIFGKNPIREALETRRLKTIYVSDGFTDTKFLEKIKNSAVPIIYKTTRELNLMVSGVHQGLVGEIKPYEYSSLEEIIHLGNKKENPIVVILDGINDPHNLGAIIRSCDVFGVSGVIVKKHNQASLNSTVAKTSAGAINYVKVAQVSNLNNAIQRLKDEGYWVVSTDGSGKTNYQDLKYDFKVALIVGSEGEGISSLLLKNSDYIVKIPMFGHVNSLNASVATAILLSEIRK